MLKHSDTRQDELLKTLHATVTRHAMFAAGQTVVVGASGGPDSTALLHALSGLRDEWRLSLVACHLNHGFRGAEAAGDAEYVRELCDRLEVPCRVELVDVPALKKRRHLSAQQAARSARHAFLQRIAGEVGAARIALAHTRDDRIETVLLNITRGSGLEGLSGFPPVALPLVRPLYDTSRLIVEQYCLCHALQPRRDSSNAKLDYRRNRVRAELLPQLRAYYNPKADDALVRLAELAAEDNALLETLATDALTQISDWRDVDSVSAASVTRLTLPLGELNALPLALRRRVLRQAIALVRGHLQDVSFEVIANLCTAAAEGRIIGCNLPASGGEIVYIRGNARRIAIHRAVPLKSDIPWQLPLATPGRTFVPQAGVFIDTRFCTPTTLPAVLEAWQSSAEETAASPSVTTKPGLIVVFARQDVKFPLVARSWRPGDRMRPHGLSGTKKLQDLFTDAKIPVEIRQRVPVVVDADGTGNILMAGGLRATETAWAVFAVSPRMSPVAGPASDPLPDQIVRVAMSLLPEQELLAIGLQYH